MRKKMLKNNIISFAKNIIYLITLILYISANQAFAKDDEVKANQDDLVIDQIDSSHFYNIATVQILNKTTAKTSIVDLKVGHKVKFNTLTIIAHKCWKSSLDQKPESKILLEIFEEKSGSKEQMKKVFYGWMFASSPSISGLENPIYDLVATGCKNK